MKKSLMILSFSLLCIFGLRSSPARADNGQDGVAIVQSADPATFPVLRRGSFGDDVYNLQVALDALGFSPGKPDGDFGPKTEAAVMELQGALSLTQDGVVDQRIWAYIIEHLPEEDRPVANIPFSTEDEIIALSESVISQIIGKRERDAVGIVAIINPILARFGCTTQLELRTVSVNGDVFPVTTDWLPNRINLTIEGGIIIRAEVH